MDEILDCKDEVKPGRPGKGRVIRLASPVPHLYRCPTLLWHHKFLEDWNASV